MHEHLALLGQLEYKRGMALYLHSYEKGGVGDKDRVLRTSCLEWEAHNLEG